MRLVLILLLVLAPVLADTRGDALQVALRYRDAFLKSQRPEELYPFLSKASIAKLEADRLKDSEAFKRTWELAHAMSTMDVMATPAGAKVLNKLTVQGNRATYVTGYEVKSQSGSSKSTQTTHLILEDGAWKVDFYGAGAR